MKRLTLIPALLLLAIFFSACGGGGGGTEVTLNPVGNEMKFEQTSFTVKAGQEVTVTLNNTASSPAMSHNFVLLNTTADDVVNRVGMAALEAGESRNYIPEDDAILAHTDLAAPGATVTVTFTAPTTPGDYKYICTFPGHYMLMQGVMTVTA